MTPPPQDQAESPQPLPQREPFWPYQDVLVFIGMVPLCLIFGALFVKGVLVLIGWSHPPKAIELLPGQFVGYALMFVFLAVMFRIQHDRPFWRSLGFGPPKMPLAVTLACGSGVALGIALTGAALRMPDIESPIKELLSDPQSLIWLMLAGVTLGPLSEELVFRGLLQPLFARSLGPAGGIVLAGFLFGLTHLPQYGLSWRHALLITLAGSSFGWMRHRTGSTTDAALMHSAYNLTLFIGFLAARKEITSSW